MEQQQGEKNWFLDGATSFSHNDYCYDIYGC